MIMIFIEILISVLTFVSLAGLVLALFHQPEAARRATQAEASLEFAAVQNDLFRDGMTAVLLWPFLVLAHRLNAPRLKQKLRRDLIAAGRQYEYTPSQWLALMLTAAAAGAVFGEIVGFTYVQSMNLTGPLIGGLLGWSIARLRIGGQARRRARAIERKLPYTLDLVSLSMGAGATFVEAVDTITRDDPNDPFNEELRAMMAEIELGKPRREAMLNLAGRVPLETLRSIVTAIVQAEALGTPLADVLRVQANLLRLQRTHRAEKLAGEAAVKLLVPSVLIFVAVVITVFSPYIVRFVRGELY